jgi:hypothetical protein
VAEPVQSRISQVCLSMIHLAVLSTHLFDTAIASCFWTRITYKSSRDCCDARCD